MATISSSSTLLSSFGSKLTVRRSVPTVFLLVFVAALMRGVVRGGAYYWGDLFLYFYPMEHTIRQSLLAGRLPLWNPFVMCGQPMVGNPQCWLYYPTTILLNWMPEWRYYSLDAALHMCLLAGGCYLFFRRVTGDRVSALFGSIVYVGGGCVFARLQFPTMIQAMAYLPWALLLIDRIIERPGLLYGAGLAMVIGLEIMAGHAQVAYTTIVAAICYMCARLWQVRRHPQRAREAGYWFAAASLVGILISSAQLIPTLQLFAWSTRVHLGWKEANRFILYPGQLVGLVAPRWFGSPAAGDYWADGNMWEPCIYIGIIPLVMAAYGAWLGRHRRSVRVFLAMSVVGLWLATGRIGGLYWLAFKLVPGIASFHDPARFTIPAMFGVAGLAAYGMRILRERGMSVGLRTCMVVFGAANLLWYGRGINPTTPEYSFTYTPPSVELVPKSGAGRTYTLLDATIWRRYLNYTDYGPDSATYAHELAETLVPDVASRFGVEDAGGYEPVPLRTVSDVNEWLKLAGPRGDVSFLNGLRLLNVTRVMTPMAAECRTAGLIRIKSKGVSVYNVTHPGSRAWFVPYTRRIDGTLASLSAIMDPGFDSTTSAIVSGSSGLERIISPPGVARIVSVQSLDEAYNVQVVVSGSPQWLVLSQAIYPGWTAQIDGVARELAITDHAFVGLAVPTGRHNVAFRYQPASVFVGTYVSLAALSAVVASAAAGLVLRRRLRQDSRTQVTAESTAWIKAAGGRIS